MDEQQILDALRNEDPDTIVELLEISTDELIDAFYEKIEYKIEYLRKQYET